MTFYIFSMSHNIYVFNFCFTVDKKNKPFGFTKNWMKFLHTHLSLSEQRNMRTLQHISIKGACGLRQAIVPAIFRYGPNILRVNMKIGRCFAFHVRWFVESLGLLPNDPTWSVLSDGSCEIVNVDWRRSELCGMVQRSTSKSSPEKLVPGVFLVNLRTPPAYTNVDEI